MLKWRSGCSSSSRGLVSQPARADHRPGSRPAAAAVRDDVQHYQKLLGRPTRLELVELREDDKVAGRIPERAYVVCSTADGRSSTPRSSRMARGAPPGGPRPLLRRGRPARARPRALRHEALVRADDAAAPARARRAARAALSRPQDPRRRAVPLLIRGWTPLADLRAADRRGRAPRAPAQARVRRLLDERRDAARADGGQAAARGGGARSAEELKERLGGDVERIDVAGPGLPQPVHERAAGSTGRVAAAVEQGDDFGGGSGGERVLVEFVSANPTGPMTVASARGAAIGDALARLLEFAGNEVEREYYINDYGTQVRLLRRVDPRPGARRGAARGRLPGRVHRRAGGARSTAPPSATRRSWRVLGVEHMMERVGARSSASASTSTASSPSARCTTTARSSACSSSSGEPRVRARGRALAAHVRRSATRRTAC